MGLPLRQMKVTHMTSKSALKAAVKKHKKRLRDMRKIVKVGIRTIQDRDIKIAQLTSVLSMEGNKRHKIKVSKSERTRGQSTDTGGVAAH
jgi:hypothetical protein